MVGIVTRLGWFAVVALVVAHGTYFLVGNAISAQASGIYDPIVVRDSIGASSHTLSGMVQVPTACDELSLNTIKRSSTEVELVFTTWHEPSVTCKEESVPRSFHAMVFAPSAGVTFTATLDGESLPITIVQVIAGH